VGVEPRKPKTMSDKLKNFESAIEGVKFTKAQKGIVSILLRGWEIRVVNRHSC